MFALAAVKLVGGIRAAPENDSSYIIVADCNVVCHGGTPFGLGVIVGRNKISGLLPKQIVRVITAMLHR